MPRRCAVIEQLERAGRALVDTPARPVTPLAEIERRARVLTARRSRIRVATVAVVAVLGLGVAALAVHGSSSSQLVVGPATPNESVQPASGGSCPSGAKGYVMASAAMEPTLHPGERLLVASLSDPKNLARGAIVSFAIPTGPGSPSGATTVKRIVGLPGETIEAVNGKVEVDGVPLDEPYLAPGTITSDLPRQRVPAGSYFLLGDHRSNSQDSRFFGPVSTTLITGSLCATG